MTCIQGRSRRITDALTRTASERPKSRQAPIAPTGVHLPKIIAARAIKPRPATMPTMNPEAPGLIDKMEPANPASRPLHKTPI